MSELLKIGFFSSKLFKIVKRIVKVVNFFRIVKNCQKIKIINIIKVDHVMFPQGQQDSWVSQPV